MRVGVLNNLRAGRNQKEVSHILALLTAYPDVVHVETESAGALPEAIAELARQEVDLLVLNGGDGTLQHALTEILDGDEFDRIPLIAPLRGGRTNMTALDVGAHRNPVKGLHALLEAVRRGRVAQRIVERPVLRVERGGARGVQYGMFFGAGMIHRAIDLTHRLFPSGKSQGVFGAGVVTASLVTKAGFNPKEGVLKPDKVQVFLDGSSVPQGELQLVIATSLDRLFLRINPFWGRGPGGVRFTTIAAGAERFLRAAPGVLYGRPPAYATSEAGYTSRNCELAELYFDCGFTVDGEIFEAQTAESVIVTADRRSQFVRA